jgi:hypothetical protein
LEPKSENLFFILKNWMANEIPSSIYCDPQLRWFEHIFKESEPKVLDKSKEPTEIPYFGG